VAFFEIEEDGAETLKFIWAPNSTVEYSAATNSYTREGNVEPYYYYQKSSTFVNHNRNMHKSMKQAASTHS
jgi:hypothetical protein